MEAALIYMNTEMKYTEHFEKWEEERGNGNTIGGKSVQGNL